MQAEIITFRKNEYGVTRQSRGHKAGKLAVSPSGSYWKVYDLESGKCFLPFSFRNKDDALYVAEWLGRMYGEYLILLKEYEPAPVIAMCQLSIPHGQEIYRAAQKLEDHVVTKQDFVNAIRIAKEDINNEVNKNKYIPKARE